MGKLATVDLVFWQFDSILPGLAEWRLRVEGEERGDQGKLCVIPLVFFTVHITVNKSVPFPPPMMESNAGECHLITSHSFFFGPHHQFLGHGPRLSIPGHLLRVRASSRVGLVHLPESTQHAPLNPGPLPPILQKYYRLRLGLGQRKTSQNTTRHTINGSIRAP